MGVTLLKLFLPAKLNPVPAFSTLAGIGLGAFLYAASFLLWVFLLSKLPLSYAYPVSIGISLFATTLVGILIFKETLTTPAIVGICLLPVVVILISVKSPTP